ncbi:MULTISPECIES: porin family protein [Myroides]|uniref:Outer membrane beta-barrel protein n=1 Tax=Myroides albus TaxID=2562892 RepID=A0A6I3LK53_9FLAO|nr:MULTISPECIES: porin family protein [Myroides]MTG96871.1 outer membrane beta-barrel protein [Myroides albus]MVX36505.1 outer membrane beta-barrel protein [Myroides sp. LoEW2-1]UVD78379.1 PorT family protein [Myroides albus]
MNKKIFFTVLFFHIISISFGQIEGEEFVATDSLTSVIKEVDYKYREDQFYFGVTHTLMQDKPAGYSPYSFSIGVNGGFLRDFPINKSRTVAIAPGIGYSYLNLRSSFGLNENLDYVILDSYKQSALSIHSIDFPIEFRWRNSTPDSHKFWRVYLGFKASYRFSDRFKTKTSEYTRYYRNDDNLNKWLYGVYASLGFNTWNFYVYYGLNNIYKKDMIANDSQRLKMLNVGLMFYIL